MSDTNSKHTPGPWKVVIDDTGGEWSGWPLCIEATSIVDKTVVRTGGQWPYEWDSATSQDEAVANARLIAAAPELLEALRVLVDRDFTYFDGAVIGAATKITRDEVLAARAVIAKATGSES